MSIPDGGFVAWLQCASSFSLFMCTWGIVSSFGVFQNYYEQAFPEYSASDISWIGSVQAFLLTGLGLLTGPLYDYGHLRSLVISGSTLTVLGMILTSFCSQYWQVLCSQGLLLGLGSGCLFVPSVAVLPTYFDKRQRLALGVGAAGSALGGIIFPIIFQQLQPRIGFGWTTRIIGLIMLTLLTLPVLGMRMRVRPSSARRLFDATALKELPFLLSCLYFLLAFLGAYIPTFYIQVLGIKDDVVSNQLAVYLVPLLNFGSFFGRIVPGYIADHLGLFNVDAVCVIATGVLAFAWVAVHSNVGIVVFIVLYGFFSGALTSLSPNIAVALSPDMGVFGVRLGMLLIPLSTGLLLGNPIAGAISSSTQTGLQIFTGTVMAAASACIVLVRVVMYGRSWKRKC